MNRPLRLFGVVGALALGAVACSGDDDTAPTPPDSSTVPTTTAAAETTVATTVPPTTAPVDTTVPATTEPVETTSPATSAVPTSTTLPDGVPPRVTFPDDPDLQAVVDAYYAQADAFSAALADPSNDALLQAAVDASEDPLRGRVRSVLEGLRAVGEAYVTNPDQPGYTQVFASTVVVVEGTAAFDGCSFNTDVKVEVGGNPDDSDRVIDDSISSSLLSYNLVRVGEDWKLSDVVRVESFEGQLGCD